MRFAFKLKSHAGALLFVLCATLGGGWGFSAPNSAAAISAAPFSKVEMRQEVSQFGITWHFEKPVPVGQFVNGDFYVIGSVTVERVDPAPLFGAEIPETEIGTREKARLKQEDLVRNGSMLNPPARQAAAFDSGIRNFYDPSLAVRFPVALKPGDALVSSISLKVKEEVNSLGSNRKGSREEPLISPVKTAAVLTCVADVLAVDAFRPSYGDREQVIFKARDLKQDKLPRLKPAGKVPDLTALLRAFERPWINPCFFGFEQPMENMPSYGQWVSEVQSLAGLVLLLDLPSETREELLIRFVQVGIDYWGLVRNGHPGWQGWGGHGSGRKFPIVLSGLLLGDAKMASPTRAFPKVEFGEDNQTCFGEGWTGAKALFAGHSGIQSATGKPERPKWGPYEHLHPEMWSPSNLQSESYRRANTSSVWVGQALVIRLLNAEREWNHDAFLEYVDRWMTEEDSEHRAAIMKFYPDTRLSGRNRFSKQGFTWNPFTKQMWEKYRKSAEDGN